jgi:NAD(P)-dependent dehydrogenase (short-subunit alcohol dehydrogenase family)
MKRRTAVITGGGQGIGKVTAKELLKENIQVAILEIDGEAGEETSRGIDLPDQFLFIQTDITKENEVKYAIERIIEKFNSLDILINNAAIAINKPIDQLCLDEWERVIKVNLTGAFLCTKYALPYLKKSRGAIINLCSTRAFMSEPNTEAYSASKGGIYAFTHAMAMSLGPDIRVNCISPGWIDVTPYQKNSKREKIDLSAEDHLQHPVGRVGNPKDISSMIRFLIDEKNSFITGQNFIIDGGMTRKMIYV